MTTIRIESDNLKPFISDEEIDALQPEITRIHDQMERGEGAGSDFLGWYRLPSETPEELIDRIEESAGHIREDADCLIVIGIGGSYLGARAAVEFVNHTFHNQLTAEKRERAGGLLRGPEHKLRLPRRPHRYHGEEAGLPQCHLQVGDDD